MNQLAPIVIFVYNRPEHTRKTLESLMANDLANESELFIYVDGPKPNATQEDLIKIGEVKKVIYEKPWCGKVNIHVSEMNRTLPVALVEKVTEIADRFGRIIVLEDDLVLAKGFLKFMNEGLDLYMDSEKVMGIAGYMYPLKANLPQTFFLNLSFGWGWATWNRAWKLFNPSAEELMKKVEEKGIHSFTFNDTNDYWELLKKCAIGSWKYWDIRWQASVFVNDGLFLLPRVSLVRNIGHDGSGLHCGTNFKYQYQRIAKKVNVIPQQVSENVAARRAMTEMFVSLRKPTLKDKLIYKFWATVAKTQGVTEKHL